MNKEDELEPKVSVPKKTFDEMREMMLSDFESGKARDWKQIAETNGRHTISGWIHNSQDELEVRKGMVKLISCIEKEMFWPGPQL